MRDYFVPELGGTIEIPDSMSDQDALRHVRTKLLPQLGVKPVELPKTVTGQVVEFGKGLVDAIPRGMISAGRGLAGLSMASPAQLETQQRLSLEDPRLTGYRDLKSGYEQSGMGQALQAAPGYEDSYARMGGSALGSTVPLLAASVFGGGAPALALAMAQGAGNQGENIDEQRRQGKKVSDDQEKLALALGAGIGATEMVPLNRLTGPLQNVVMRGIANQTGRTAGEVARKGLAGALTSMGIQAAEEGLQEGGSQFLNNLVEQQTYNDKRGLGEGVIQSALLGATVGAGLDGTLGRMARRLEAQQLERLQEPTRYMNFPAPGPAMQENSIDSLSQLFPQQPQAPKPQPASRTVQSWEQPFEIDPSVESFYGTKPAAVQQPTLEQPKPAAPRRRKQELEVPETGVDESVARAVAAREDLAKQFGKKWEDLSNSERIAIDDLIAEGNTGSPTQAYSMRRGMRPQAPLPTIAGASARMAAPRPQVPQQASVPSVAPAAPQGVSPVAAEAGSSTEPTVRLAPSSISPETVGQGQTLGDALNHTPDRGTPERSTVDASSINLPAQPQVTAWKQKAAPRLIESRRFADKVGAKDLHLRFIENVEDRIAGKPVTDAKGAYENGLIQVAYRATESPESLIGTTTHEITHGFKQAGLFNAQEWTALEKQVQRDGTLAEIQQDEYYGKLTPEQQKEEAIAHAFERFVVGELKSTGQTAGLFNRAKNFLGRLHSGLKGQGFVTAQDVMNRFNEGDIGRRNRPNGVEINTGARINGNVAVVNGEPDRTEQVGVEAQPTGVGRTQEDLPQALISGIGDQSGIEGGETMYSRRRSSDVEPNPRSLETKRIEDVRPEGRLRPSMLEDQSASSQEISPKTLSQPKDTPLYSKPLRSANPQVSAEYDKVFGKVEHPSIMQKIQAVFASKDSRRDAITLTRQELFDGRARIAEGTRLTAKSDRDLMADVSADAAARFADRSSNVFAAALTHGYLKYDKGFVSAQGGKGLLTILDPLVKKNLTEEWALYMAAKRGGKLLTEGRENLMTQPQINSALALAQQHPELQTAEKEYNDWNKSIVQLLVDTGRIDQQTADKWTSGTYLPFYRLIEDEMISPRMSRTIAGGKKIQGLKGGTSKINDPLTNIIQNGLALTDIAMKNVAAQRAIRDAVQLGWARAATYGDKGSIVTVYKNGKALKFKVEDQLLYDAMTQSDLPSGPLFDLVLGGSRAAAQTLRSLVTKSPTFFVKNGIRDSLDVWAKGGHDMTPILSALDGVRQVVNNSPAYQALERSGVVGGTLLEGGAEGTAQRIQRKLDIASDARTKMQKFWDALGEASDKSEAVNRVKIYEDAMRRHGNEAQAAYEALEVMNFSRQGRSAIVRLTSAMIPFFNARLQGLDWMGRGLAGHAYGYDASIGGRGKEIQKTMIRRGLFIAGVTMAYAFLQSDNDDWLNASPEERANNWFIPMGEGKPSVRVPIPFELGFIFKTVPEDIMANLMKVDTNKQTVEYIKTGLMNQLMQPLVPQAVKPLVENFANYSFFKGREIESASQKRLSPEFRSDDYTSELAKFIGEQTGSSPLKIDNVLKGYTGTAGNMVLQVLDNVMREGKGEPPERAIWQIPGLSSFIQRPDGARQIIDFYESYTKISQIAQDIKLLQQSDPEKAMKRMKDFQNEVALEDIAESTSRRMTDLRKLKKVVQNDPNMPGADKRKMLDEIRKQEIQLTKPVNETIRKVTGQ